MVFKLAILIATLLFSGCALSKNNQYERNILTIKEIDKSLNKKIKKISDDLEKQVKEIALLQDGIQKIQKDFEESRKIESLKKVEEKNSKDSVSIKPSKTTNVITLGQVEWVKIKGIDQSIEARVDTGASISSLSATNIEKFERNGEKWVRFEVNANEMKKDSKNIIEAPILRVVNIKQSSNKAGQDRIIVSLWVMLGSIKEKTEFSLTNRSHMTYSILLGRKFIKDIAVVDVSKKYVHSKKEEGKL